MSLILKSGTECVDGDECGPQLIEREEVWCCVWCGIPVPLTEKEEVKA